MQSTPVHDYYNHDLLKFIPPSARKLIEIGCGSGVLAREFKAIAPDCHYLGVEIDASYAALARRHCDDCLVLDIELADDAFWDANADRECWIFGDSLEHLKDPWATLRKIRQNIPQNGCVVACIPNAQHWSLQARLSIGDWRYEESGLLDRTHLRWFTRQTMLEMFDQTGFTVETGMSRIFDEPDRERFLPVIEKMASMLGVDAEMTIQDSMPLQYILRAIINNS